MTILTKANFFQKAQQLLEQYYLQPMDGSLKKHLKDGYLERGVHGATHACRAALWTLTMHNFLLKHVPDTVNKAMAKIAIYLNIEEDSF